MQKHMQPIKTDRQQHGIPSFAFCNQFLNVKRLQPASWLVGRQVLRPLVHIIATFIQVPLQLGLPFLAMSSHVCHCASCNWSSADSAGTWLAGISTT